jgi:hypothetical protein
LTNVTPAASSMWLAAGALVLPTWSPMPIELPVSASHLIFRSDEAADEGQSGLRNFTPTTVYDKRVPTVWHFDEFSDAGIALLQLV